MVRLGDYSFNLEHPPLAKDLAGLALLPLSPRPISDAWNRLDVAGNVFEAFLYGNRVSSGDILRAARLPFPFVLLALEVLVLATVRRLGAPALALPAALLVGLDPNFVAHAAWVHTDVPASLAFLATLGAGIAFLSRPGVIRAAGAGAVLGLSLVTKFSAVLLVPMLVVAAVVLALDGGVPRALEGRGQRALRRYLSSVAKGAAIAAGAALAVLLLVYRVDMRGMTDEAREAVLRRHLTVRGAPPALISWTAALARISPGLGHFAAGLAGVSLQGERGQGVSFLDGHKSRTGWPSYFPRAFVYKTALPLLLLLPAGALLSVRARRVTPVPLILVVSALVYVGASIPSAYNIGVRHLLPVYPLLVVAGAVSAGALVPERTARAAAWGGAALLLLATLRIHPHEVSFFGAAGGGPGRGPDLLSDSNVDWGQDLWRLREWRAARPVEPLSILYFGGATARFELPGARDLRFEPATAPLPPGLYAVSEFLLRIGPDFFRSSSGDREASALTTRLLDALRDRGEEVARIGYSIHLFRLRPMVLPPGRRGAAVQPPPGPERQSS